MAKNIIKIDPYIQVYGSSGVKLPLEPDSFRYTYREEGDDECVLRFCSSNVFLADLPYLQEGQKLIVEWGYNSTKEAMKRVVYIFDTETSYDEEGITLTITCHEKFTMTKINKSSSSVGSALKPNSSKDSSQLVLGFEVLNQVEIEIDKGNKELEDLLRSAGIVIKNKTVSITSSGWVDDKSKSALGRQSNQNVGMDYKAGDKVNERGVKIQEGMERIYHTPTVPTYRLLRQLLDKLPGGPYVIDSRDEKVTLRTRDFTASPVKSYTYAGEDGELLSIRPETKNRSKSTSSSVGSAIGWDALNKKAMMANSNKNKGATLADGNSQNNLIRSLWAPHAWAAEHGIPTYNTFAEIAANNPGKAKPAEKRIPPPTWGYDSWDEVILADKKRTEGDTTPEKLGGRKEPVYNPEVNKEEIVLFETWEKEARKPGDLTNSAQVDNTFVHRKNHYPFKRKDGEVPEKTSLLGKETKNKIAAYASNKREDNQLKNNPASATMVGNPYLESGQIVTFLGIAKKHSGNYYLKTVEHSIEDSQGYITTISEMVRQGPMKENKSVPVKASNQSTERLTIEEAKPSPITANNNTKNPKELTVNTKVGPKIQEPGHRLTAKAGEAINISINGNGVIIGTNKAREV